MRRVGCVCVWMMSTIVRSVRVDEGIKAFPLTLPSSSSLSLFISTISVVPDDHSKDNSNKERERVVCTARHPLCARPTVFSPTYSSSVGQSNRGAVTQLNSKQTHQKKPSFFGVFVCVCMPSYIHPIPSHSPFPMVSFALLLLDVVWC